MNTKRLAYILFPGLIIFIALIWWFYPIGREPSYGLLNPSNAAVVSAGEKIYELQCASCHGKNLEGQENWKGLDAEGYMPAPPHDISGHTWHHTDEILFELTKYGLAKYAGLQDYKTRMPSYEDALSDEEIIAVLSYIKSKWPEETRIRHDELNKQKSGDPK